MFAQILSSHNNPLLKILEHSIPQTTFTENFRFFVSILELCHAATRIQATFRGHLARKVANEGQLKDEKDLQEITKKVAEELDIDLTDPELNKAATKIQASFRGHKSRQTE